MPYIKNSERERLEFGGIPTTPGELNFSITMAMLAYAYGGPHGLNYTRINDVIGALECAKMEFYRRVVVPYEEEKRKDNGDVYPDEDEGKTCALDCPCRVRKV